MDITMKDIKDFPSKQAEEIQNKLKDLDEQGKLLEYFKEQYTDLGKSNSIANYILEDFENRKYLFIQWTGIETFSDKHTIKRTGVKLSEIAKGSNKYFLWKCSICGHEWSAQVANRTNAKSGCPKCAKVKISESNHKRGETLQHWCDTQGTYGQQLKEEFTGQLEDGTPVTLGELSKGSNAKIWWKCSSSDCNYMWKATVVSRTSVKSGCPKCGRLRTIEAVHLRGETLEHWCNTQGIYGQQLKNEFTGRLADGTPISIGNISKGSHAKVYWHCSNPYCNYEWTAKINNRTSKNRQGCPACGGTALIKGVNDLETYCHQHTELSYLLEEFVGLDKNNKPIKIDEIARGSHSNVQWKCNKCHKIWIATPHNRTDSKSGCPYCNKNSTSFPEQYIYQSLKQLFPDTLSRAKDPINNYEYDITIPSLKLCIEYSGYSWHKSKLERDLEKEEHCKHNNVQFLQIYAHSGNIKDTDGNIAQDTYTPNQILYKVERDKALHIIQLQHIIEFILEQYAPKHSIEEIDFTLVEQEASKVMGKA